MQAYAQYSRAAMPCVATPSSFARRVRLLRSMELRDNTKSKGAGPMHPMRSVRARQRHSLRRGFRSIDACAFFDLLADSPMLDQVELLLPVHRERLLPPTDRLAR